MIVKPITDPSFAQYGKIIEGFDTGELLAAMEKTPLTEKVAYVASVPELEATKSFEAVKNDIFGGMPIQFGYCNGVNHSMDALEYHKDSEVNLACFDQILVLGRQQDIDPETLTYDTANAEAFSVPAGTLYEMYATTLHYAPIGEPFRCLIVLPRGTNFDRPFPQAAAPKDAGMLTHVNKWLLAHPESGITGTTGVVTGENIKL